ncbi:MAG: HAMP domain-containing sensor histidine kinase [Acidimicrobiia bacterium]
MTRERARSLLAALIAGAVLVLVAAQFTNVTVASHVARNADRLQWANSTLGSAALTRAAAGQAAIFEGLDEAGIDKSEALQIAVGELADTRARLQAFIDEAPVPVDASITGFMETLEADPLDMDAVDAAYWPVENWLSALQDQIRADIASSQASAARLWVGIRLAITLALPILAILFYRRQAAAKLRRAELKMEAEIEAQREISRAKDEFVSAISHEIRTPLTGILGFSEMLVDSPPDAGADRDLVRIINAEANDLNRMVDDFIIASRLVGAGVAVDVRPTDLGTIVGEAIRRMRRLGADVVMEGEAGQALADSGRVAHILNNLLSNAYRHGGDRIAVVLSDSATDALVTVIDDGDGVPDEMADRLFARFAHRSADVVVSGSLGLGSWVARELARMMGGDVTYERRRSTTRFTLALPRVPAQDEEESDSPTTLTPRVSVGG